MVPEVTKLEAMPTNCTTTIETIKPWAWMLRGVAWPLVA